jgi:hypothetical protein
MEDSVGGKRKMLRKRANDDGRRSLEAKRRKKYDSRRIYLGTSCDEWDRQRSLLGQSHSEFAEHLLSVHSQHCAQSSCSGRVYAADRLVNS